MLARAPGGAAEEICWQGPLEELQIQYAFKGSCRSLDRVEGELGGGHAPHLPGRIGRGVEGELESVEGVDPKCMEPWSSSLSLRRGLCHRLLMDCSQV